MTDSGGSDGLEVARGYSAWLAQPLIRRSAGRLALGLFNGPLLVQWPRLRLTPADRVLDLGCGAGTVLSFLASRIGFERPPVGIDASAGQVALGTELLGSHGGTAAGAGTGRPLVCLVQGSAARLPFADESFDVVLSSHVLHNLDEDVLDRALSEVRRVLRGGGRFCLWAFGSPHPWRNQVGRGILHALMRPPAAVRRHTYFRTERELVSALDRAGFVDVRPGPLRGFFWPPACPRICLAGCRG